MSGMFKDIHEKVTQAQLSEKLTASDIHLKEDLCNLDNMIDDFANEKQWNMDDFHTKKMVEMFQRMKKQFSLVKQVVESAQY